MPVKKKDQLLLMPTPPRGPTCMSTGHALTGGQGSRSWSRPADSPKSDDPGARRRGHRTETPMERQLTHIGNQLVVICCAVCASSSS